MVRPRSWRIPEGSRGTYHVLSRCTRRAFLMGNEYGHRRQWMVEELSDLLGGFCVDLQAYAIMSNHIHLVLRPRPDRIAEWQAERVARVGLDYIPVRTGIGDEALPVTKELISRYSEQAAWVEEYRQRLSSVSWLMRLLKQRVAIRANQEDGCTGHFWESRFHSVPLLDWSAVLGCMIYVDLNPIRARIAEKFQSVAYSSLKSHCGMVVNKSDEPLAKHLVPLRKCCPVDPLTGEISPVRLSEAEFHDLASRACGRNDRAGGSAIDSLGQRLGVDWDSWKVRMAEPGLFQSGAVGRPTSLRQYAETVGRKWIADKTRIWAKE